jgi:hypothetical protein
MMREDKRYYKVLDIEAPETDPQMRRCMGRSCRFVIGSGDHNKAPNIGQEAR